jgi:hypothetical protein
MIVGDIMKKNNVLLIVQGALIVGLYGIGSIINIYTILF